MTFHHKQPFDPSGNVYANSVTRTMKGQALSTWDMFTRETLQNSWDARDRSSHDDGVSFAIDLTSMDSSQVECLRDQVFGNDFDGIPELGKALQGDSLSVLKVSDSGTRGLRGPTVASQATEGPTEFVAFIRNIGRSDTKEVAGGTYGFGKGVFFIVSEVNTVVVYTRTVDEFGKRVSRLISMANADDFIEGDISFTGRHWWGEFATGQAAGNNTEFAEPFLGEKADRLANALGLDTYFDEERPTGTTIMVLQPDLEDAAKGTTSRRAAMENVAKSLTRWAWPHMLGVIQDMDPIDFKVLLDGEEIPIPKPEDDPALKWFVLAYLMQYQNAESVEWPENSWYKSLMTRTSTMTTLRPHATLGRISVCELADPISENDTLIDEEINSHIALIRLPQMVVQYKKGPVSSDGKPYAGVFIADSRMDKVFARSEPAAHHEWNFQTVQHDTELLAEFWGSKARVNPVKIFNTRFVDLLKQAGTTSNLAGDDKHFTAVTKLSDNLGKLVSNAKGGLSFRVASNKKPKIPKTPVPSNKPRISTTVGRVCRVNGQLTTVFKITTDSKEELLPFRFEVLPTVALEGGTMSQDEALESFGVAPTLTDLQVIEGELYQLFDEEDSPTNEVEVCSRNTIFEAHVSQPEDLAISLNTKLSPLESASANVEEGE